MIMQNRSDEELCNLLVQSIISRDEKLLRDVLDHEDETTIKDVINRLPANYVRKLLIELGNLLSSDLTPKHLRWVQNLLALKYSVVSTMSDGRSILLPLISLLEDRSSPEYYNKVQGLKGKVTLLQQMKEARRTEMAETVVKLPGDADKSTRMEVESETDTESEDELDNNQAQENVEEEQHEGDDNDEVEEDDEDEEMEGSETL